ncbi:PLDc N-terminal domain-containing protein [Glutamicibacter sp. BW77]|uniref:PLDc N-terminal domain-containing protein n=2 Tax=Glutamicibacter TaxID=1742989 RepID=A0ABV9MJM5_9MICC|nr:PLDc N-terminal domain-containing protein [Glutamicibacter sp. BW77]PCC32705.1 hypothetical protein CIK74_15420 [Glutamicibacter sp. BW77]HBV10519.1 hypothetical protein [Micrococcaceae bacterium]
MATKRTFKELSTGAQIGVIVTAIIELTLTIAALRDLQKRPAEQVKGSKKLWALASLINIFGPIAYFLFGRRK